MLVPSSPADAVIAHLKTLAAESNLAGMTRFGIETDQALGIKNPALNHIARLIKRDHGRALTLWDSNIREARLLAALTAEPQKLTLDMARQWTAGFNSWEIVDSLADLFVAARLEAVLIPEFAADDREFVRRTAFSMIAVSAVHLKKEPDETVIAWLPLVEAHAGDGRNFVKKAVNWALRQTGKRSACCHGPALSMAQALAARQDPTARWIGKDAVRELTGSAVLKRLGPQPLSE
ncbi:DNA alkylation repair protein [Pararhizobium sp. DWP1-1-3]|uniref:DNA alkylation repair protein n=1 Tax=Pararhizobium sp. DWP1-1-3 TaxID=2804652 RepID=UPI003CEC1E9C